MLRAMVIEPGKLAEVRYINLDFAQKLLGKDIEVTNPFDDEIAVLVNAQGKILGLPLNRSWADDEGDIVDIFAGPMIIISEKGNITDDQVKFLLQYFGAIQGPEDWFSDEEEEDATDKILDLLWEIFFGKEDEDDEE